MPPVPRKRVPAARDTPNKRSRLDEGKGRASQPGSDTDASQSRLRMSPRRALAFTASQATDEGPLESQLRDMIPEDTIVVPA
ncbi:hypothetical protein HBI23_257220 [Parastagonospora nodorum]|nr:hypothetical protein HBI23_257220 [Parastagonospora nodorum]KAH5619820.1 hypothetical protein HBI51_251920 [Parastagonospora nodorum]KAH5983155.1 hypothetical protein HBI84_248910 [Parastagonospora nodorum]KAH6132822.1 hypothetical protein HBI68_254950 [Parastagonospora nodorum]KAH6380428.1 hypothetical protein HBI08_241010 [Parastagonospora nodorum]